MHLTSEEKTLLLKIARKALEYRFDDKIKIPVADYEQHPVLKSKGGVFVTLTIDDKLRGCIGYITSDTPINETVHDAAIQAGFFDPRFPSLLQEELNQIEIEISILSEPFLSESYDEIELGTHGLILEEGSQRGLLLPQVPIEHGMNKEEYLDAICRKAGFHASYWKEKQLQLLLFTADIFSEKETEVKNESN